MSDDELVEANERLANPPMVDFALSRMLGLYVVARLAQRYNIKVQLRHSWYGGITALVLLPPTVAVRAPMPEAIEAPPSRRGPAELVASSRPAEPAAEETGDHLPIFEAARSDWFEDSVRGDHLPLRRHAAQQPGARVAEPTGNGAGAGADTARAEALRAEAMRVETARMEAARAEEAAKTGPAPAEPLRPNDPDATTLAEAARRRRRRRRPRADRPKTTRQRGDGAAARARTGPLPTRTPGASGPPPGGAKPFAPAPPPGAGQPAPSAPPAGRSSRRADRVGADRAASRRPPGPAADGARSRPGARPGRAPPPAAEPAPATLQAASVQTTKAGLPAGSRGRTSPPGWSPRGRGARRREPDRRRQPSPPPPRPDPRRRSGACCRATARASSAAG